MVVMIVMVIAIAEMVDRCEVQNQMNKVSSLKYLGKVPPRPNQHIHIYFI